MKKNLLIMTVFLLTALGAAAQDKCPISYELYDSYGDGWSGNAIKVLDASGATLATWTMTSGSTASGALMVPKGQTVYFEWVTGSYASECSYAVFDSAGEEIFSGEGAFEEGQTYSYTVDCSANCNVPVGMSVEPHGTTAIISWAGTSESYNVRYRKSKVDVLFFDDFETGLGQWTIVRNGEGTTSTDWRAWDPSNFTNPIYAHSGSNVAISRSWASSAYSVDNWLITPEVTLDGILSFWVMDDGQYHEHYDVYISTKSNAIEDFELLYEPGVASYVWTQVTVDLSNFAGQKGYIALRHTDYDQDFLLIDDFQIAVEGEEKPWTDLTTDEESIELTGLQPRTTYDYQIQAVLGEETSDWTEIASFTTNSVISKPTGVTVSEIGDNSAIVSWTENGDATDWMLEYSKIVYQDNTAYLSGDPEYVAVDENPYLLDGLDEGTDYAVRVRPGDDDEENCWSDWILFTTTTSYQAPTDLEVTEITSTTATLSWTHNGKSVSSWDVVYVAFDDDYNMINESLTEVETDQNPYTLTDLMPDTWYAYMVRPHCDVEVWSSVDYFVTEAASIRPDAIDMGEITSNSATIYWAGDESCDSYTVRYAEVPLYEDFDEGWPEGWTTIDADGDGYAFESGSAPVSYFVEGADLSGTGHNSSNDFVLSGSFSNVVGALTPDNYLVSPKVKLGGVLTFYACGQDENYPTEHFGVAVSTTSNTDASAFVTITEWDMTAARKYRASTWGPKREQGSWYKFTVDLSQFAGQEGYVAIRHFDCTDQFVLDIDDIVITSGEWIEETTTEEEITIDGLSPETTYAIQVQSTTGQYSSKWTPIEYFTTEPRSIETAITNVTASEGNDTWYTVDGRKLSAKPTTKGVFIRNKQKVVNK